MNRCFSVCDGVGLVRICVWFAAGALELLPGRWVRNATVRLLRDTFQ